MWISNLLYCNKNIKNKIIICIVVADKAYDSEDNHVLVREKLHGFSIIPPRYEQVPVWKTRGKYRKEMKRGYNKILYNQRNKDETIVSVIKRLFGEHITSKLVRMQNRELTLRCIAYNTHRMVKLIVIVMVSTQPILHYGYICIYRSILYLSIFPWKYNPFIMI